MKFLNAFLLFFALITCNQLYPESYNIKNKDIDYIIDWTIIGFEKGAIYGKCDLIFNNKKIGSIRYVQFKKQKYCYISKLKIFKKFRNNGVGGFFIKHVCEIFVAQGIKKISLEASPLDSDEDEYYAMRDRLIKFYRKCGFELDETPNKENRKFLDYKIQAKL